MPPAKPGQRIPARSRKATAKQNQDAPQMMLEATVEIEEVALAAHNTSVNILLYGPPGVGKTVLAGGAPNAVFLSTELEGAMSAKVTGSRARLWPAPSWPHAVAGIKKAQKELTDMDWLIVDSGTDMQELYMRWILEVENSRNPARDLDIPAVQNHQKYQNGFKRWYSTMVRAPYNTIFVCNSMVAADAEGEARVIPLLLGKKGEISDYISAAAGVVLYYSVSRESREADAVGPDIVRRILAQPYPPWLAKDRYGALGTSMDVLDQEYGKMAEIIDLIDRAKKKASNAPDQRATGRPRRTAGRVAR